ncbi:MAG TPA: RES family NAD+ phosphorylase [Longimicrobium sp.]|jgi:RES domain-containing protein
MPAWSYRIARAPYADLSGEGPRLYGGRWNRPGLPAVYTASSRALSVLEMLVHLQPRRLPRDLQLFTVEMPDDVPIETLAADGFPADWRAIGSSFCLDAGDEWLRGARGAVLWVPSAVVPDEYNAILNPNHPDAARIQVVHRQPFEFDPRLLALGGVSPGDN